MMDLSSNSMGAAPKGLSSSNIGNNVNSSNLNPSSSLSQANLFRPDTHVGGLQAGSDNILGAKKNASGNNNNNNNSNTSNVNTSSAENDNNNNKNNSGIKNNSNGVRYKECLKNHAANMGGYAVDGCGEFMPSGDEGSIEALKCAACGCHRNFHRREINGASGTTNNSLSLLALPSPINANNTSTSNTEYGEGDLSHNVGGGTGTSGGFGHYNIASPVSAHHHGMPAGFLPHLHHHHHHQYMHSLMGSKLMQGAHGGGGGPPTMLGGGHLHGAAAGGHAYMSSGGAGKRFRTKFTMEQREKMYEFSEKVGWRIQKQDEAAVQQFCNDAGVKRHVLKVWMHNNKNTFGKKLLRFPEAFNALPESSS